MSELSRMRPVYTLKKPVLVLPDFRSIDAESWFMILEMEFEKQGINSDDARFRELIPRLPNDIIALIKHILLKSETGQKYALARQTILDDSRPSEKTRLQQLFHDLRLGNRKPSSLLRDMRQTAGPSLVQEPLLKELWLQHLPTSVQAVLVASPSISLDQLAETADAMVDRYASPAQIAPQNYGTPHIATFDKTPDIKTEVADLRNSLSQIQLRSRSPEPQWRREIDSLKQELAELKRLIRETSRSTSRPRSRARSNDRPTANTAVCWYHEQFGTAATRCRPPCSYKPSSSGN